MKLRHSIPAALVFLLGGLHLQSQAASVSVTAHAVDEHYNHLKTFKAAFTEIYQGDGISRTESGTLWLKKPSHACAGNIMCPGKSCFSSTPRLRIFT